MWCVLCWIDVLCFGENRSAAHFLWRTPDRLSCDGLEPCIQCKHTRWLKPIPIGSTAGTKRRQNANVSGANWGSGSSQFFQALPIWLIRHHFFVVTVLSFDLFHGCLWCPSMIRTFAVKLQHNREAAPSRAELIGCCSDYTHWLHDTCSFGHSRLWPFLAPAPRGAHTWAVSHVNHLPDAHDTPQWTLNKPHSI